MEKFQSHGGSEEKRKLLEAVERLLADTGSTGQAALRMFLGTAAHLTIGEETGDLRALAETRAKKIAKGLDDETLQHMISLVGMIAESRRVWERVARGRGLDGNESGDKHAEVGTPAESREVFPGEVVFEQLFKPWKDRWDYGEIEFKGEAEWTDKDKTEVERRAFEAKHSPNPHFKTILDLSFGRVELQTCPHEKESRKRRITGRLLTANDAPQEEMHTTE